jgi:hypothetical protein
MHRRSAASRPAGSPDVERSFPARLWIGIALVLVSQAAMFARIEPFHSWHTPIAWTGYILLVDAIVWKRRRDSWLTTGSKEFIFLAIVSFPLWLIFEGYNKFFIQNWHYVGLPESLPLRYFGYVWAFSTISPAIFETGDLVASFRRRPPMPPALSLSKGPPVPRPFTPGAWASMIAGALMLLVPVVYPSPWLAAPVWLGFIFLLDPINAHAGDESLIGDLDRGRTDRIVNLMAAGLGCGFVWEFWNFWAGAKWIYTVPILPEVKIFEMPILGFGGFPPFALECFTMYVMARRWLWRGARRPISV